MSQQWFNFILSLFSQLERKAIPEWERAMERAATRARARSRSRSRSRDRKQSGGSSRVALRKQQSESPKMASRQIKELRMRRVTTAPMHVMTPSASLGGADTPTITVEAPSPGPYRKKAFSLPVGDTSDLTESKDSKTIHTWLDFGNFASYTWWILYVNQ